MSNSDDVRALRTLRVEAAARGVELYVTDSQFQEVARGLNQLQAELPLGSYVVHARAGGVEAEQGVRLNAGPSALLIRIEAPAFRSAIPALSRVAGRNAFLARAYDSLHLRPRLRQGAGAALLLFGWDAGHAGQAPQGNPLQGVSLIDATGEAHALGAEATTESHASAGTTACCGVDLTPGPYVLHLESAAGPALEQAVVVSPGWATILVVAMGYDVPAYPGLTRRLQMADAALLMAPLERLDALNLSDLRLVELARIGLSQRRAVLEDDDVSAMLDGKFHNPMLGIFGAYQLLLRPQPNRPLLEKVVENLIKLVGPHPDVIALSLRVHGQRSAYLEHQFLYPPMLRSSWRLLMERSAEAEGVVPAGSLFARVARRLLPEGECLVWRYEPEPELGMPIEQRPSNRVLVDNWSALRWGPPDQLPAEDLSSLTRKILKASAATPALGGLSNEERALLEALREHELLHGAAPLDREATLKIVRRLELPLSAVRDVAAELAGRFA